MSVFQKPVATWRKQERWQVKKLPNAKTGTLEKVKLHIGTSFVREAFCYLHKRHSSDFSGANQHGWVFFCKASPGHGEDSEGRLFPHREEGHYFVADPAPVPAS